MLSFADVSQRFKERGLYPKDGAAVQVEGGRFADIMRLGTLGEIETHVNDLLVAVRNAKARPVLEERLAQAARMAAVSSDSYELHYLASMFIHHREVMVEVARNKSIDERTQRILATDDSLRRDRAVQVALARNERLHPEVMAIILNGTDDSYVHFAVAENAAKNSLSTRDSTGGYAEICDALSVSYDSAVRQAAIVGIRDPEVLRKIAANNSTFLAPRELEAVAANKHTPDDVLSELSTSSLPRVQPLLGVKVATTARRTLNEKRYDAGLGQDGPTFA